MAKILALCKNKELHLGGDETSFNDCMFLIMMELTSGFIFTEELVEDRKKITWEKCTSEILKGFNKVVSFMSDGGQALIALGKSVFCENLMDLFHVLQDIKRLFATKFNLKRRSLYSKLKKLEKEPYPKKKKQEKEITIINKKLTVLDKGQQSYRNALFTVSTSAHPFKNISKTKTSCELSKELHCQKAILKTVSKECEIEDKQNLLDRFERRIESTSRINDLWHSWVEQSIFSKTNDAEIKLWAESALLPFVYWKEQLRKSKRDKKFQEYYEGLLKKAEDKFVNHPLTSKHLTEDWMKLAKSLVVKYQRTTSAIEGRNARLSNHYFAARGIRPKHVKPLTIIHNFGIKRSDGTTAAERLCGYKPPDLFEWILENVSVFPLPRNRSRIKKDDLNGLNLVAA